MLKFLSGAFLISLRRGTFSDTITSPHSGADMWKRTGIEALLLLVFASIPSAHSADDTPKSVGLKESVKVSLVPLEVTVWPKKADSNACVGLTADDFELRVDGKLQEIYAVDSLSAEQETYLQDSPVAHDEPAGGMSFVLFFDLWHLDLFHWNFDPCPSTKPLAFEQARRFVREEFHAGDRLLLVTATGWPIVHDGWIRTQPEALAALDRLEKTPQVVRPRQVHTHHEGWIKGMESFFLALGRYPGRKDVIYLADDFRFDDIAMKMYDVAARAQANGVVVNAIDLLSSCRNLAGPPCILGGGLGCTEFKHPVALSPLSLDTGGQLFLTDQISSAMHELRSMRKCRYLVTFKKEPRESKRSPSIALELKGNRKKELTLLAPLSFEIPEKAPTQKENNEALFLLPHFGQGISAEAAVWPYRPTGKGKRWKVFVIARLDLTNDDPLPEELTEIKVNVLLHKRSKVYKAYAKKISGDELTAFQQKRRTRLMLFPWDEIDPGETTVEVTAIGNTEEISANVIQSLDIPKPPKPGESGPWFLSNHVDRIGDYLVSAPSFDNVVTPDQAVSFIGYGCRPKGGTAEKYVGQLQSAGGGPSIPLPLTWLPKPDRTKDECGWLSGILGSPLPPGEWTFLPPASMGSSEGASSKVEFSVLSAIADEGAIPAEAKSN